MPVTDEPTTRRRTDDESETAMHYPHKTSHKKRARKLGFRARMRTANGRKLINAKRRAGRKVQVV